MRQNLKVRSGNLARIIMDGKEVGLLQNVRGSDDYSPEPVSGIGDIHVQEHVPTMARHSVTASKMALRATSLYKMGIVPENGEGMLKGMVFDIEIFDKSTGEVMRKFLSCSYASGDFEVQKHAIIATNVTFQALDVAGTL
jgi:hypothetical protein